MLFCNLMMYKSCKTKGRLLLRLQNLLQKECENSAVSDYGLFPETGRNGIKNGFSNRLLCLYQNNVSPYMDSLLQHN